MNSSDLCPFRLYACMRGKVGHKITSVGVEVAFSLIYYSYNYWQ